MTSQLTSATLVHPWKPVIDAESRVLILGSFPSVRSREEGFYYGHPQNMFWDTLAASLKAEPLTPNASIKDKQAFLLHNKVALWDVLHSCTIDGSSDASINNAVPNTFAPLIASSNIDAIFTTGKTATNLFNQLAAKEASMRAIYLPSTSPANRAQQNKPSFMHAWNNVGYVLQDKLVTAKSMKEADQFTINHLRIPSLTLMERAAQAVVDALANTTASNKDSQDTLLNKQILCVCGTGNNGGDGIAVARLLKKQGINASVLMIGNTQRLSPDCAQQLTWVHEAGVPVHTNDLSLITTTAHPHAVIVDALFGIGLARTLTGQHQEAVRAINRAKADGAYVLSVDIPSGISADTGEELGTAIQANTTVTFAYNKLGMTIEPGLTHAGTITVADIGIRTCRQADVE